MQTFLFYDIETSGLNPAFDQVLTFASIRTDFAFNEIDRHTITIRLRNDIVPSPGAFLTHGLTYDELKLGISEYDAALKIHEIINTPGTISFGYNSLKFDDTFLRFLFYRNLLDPYTHQYRNKCYRMDLLPITIVFKLFGDIALLKWPKRNGKSSLKLELISKINHFEISGCAHEAMSDVEAVIELAKKMITRKDIWNYCLNFFDKFKDEVRINSIVKEYQVDNKPLKVCLMLSTAFGADNNYIAPVMYLCKSSVYTNQSLWQRLDLEDPFCLSTKSEETFNEALKKSFVIRKKPGDELIILPMLERFAAKMSQSTTNLFHKNTKKIQSKKQKFFKFIDYHQKYEYPFIPDLDSDAALYQDGFFTRSEKKQITFFHKSLKNCKSELQNSDLHVSKILTGLSNKRVITLATRILYRNFKNRCWQENKINECIGLNKLKSLLKQDQIKGYRYKSDVDDKKNDIKFNQKLALQELEELKEEMINPNKTKKKMLLWLNTYIKNQFDTPK